MNDNSNDLNIDNVDQSTTVTTAATTTATTATTIVDFVHAPFSIQKVPKVKIEGLHVRRDKKWCLRELQKLIEPKILTMKKLYDFDWALVTFATDEDVEKVVKTLNGKKFDNSTISAKAYVPATLESTVTTTAAKRSRDDGDDDGEVKNKKFKREDRSIDDVVMPWHNVPYEQQLERKQVALKSVLRKITTAAKDTTTSDSKLTWLSKLKYTDEVEIRFEG
jgi:hypothetical protein